MRVCKALCCGTDLRYDHEDEQPPAFATCHNHEHEHREAEARRPALLVKWSHDVPGQGRTYDWFSKETKDHDFLQRRQKMRRTMNERWAPSLLNSTMRLCTLKV